MEPFDGNVLNYHHSMTLFREVVESKIEDPRGRLIRILKYTSQGKPNWSNIASNFYPVKVLSMQNIC